jgi:hypothetical protein
MSHNRRAFGNERRVKHFARLQFAPRRRAVPGAALDFVVDHALATTLPCSFRHNTLIQYRRHSLPLGAAE